MATILLVDDDPTQRKLYRHILQTEHHKVVTAADGLQALRQFDKVHPDLVMLDVSVPFRDGFSVCKEIKQKSRLTPVILITGLSAVQDRIRGIQAGADDFLMKPTDVNELLARVRSLLHLKEYTDELERAESVLLVLGKSIEAKDLCTDGHCERLAVYTEAFGRSLNLNEDEIAALHRASAVHDIGKVAVPDSILLKPGPLTTEEMEIMKQHTVFGEQICKPLQSFKLVLPIIRHHHEKQNGTGYPDGLRGAKIPMLARVLQIVDVYDALTSKRPYRKALPEATAISILEDEVKRGWWDKELVRAFRSLLRDPVFRKDARAQLKRLQTATPKKNLRKSA